MRLGACAVVLAGAGAGVIAASPSSARIGPVFELQEVIVQLAPDQSIEAFNAEHHSMTIDAMPEIPGAYLVAMVSQYNANLTAAVLESEPDVETAEANLTVAAPEIAATRIWPWTESTSEELMTQYADQLIELQAAQALSTGAGVTVAVLDTGVQLDNAVLGSVLVPGADLVDGDGVPADDRNGIDDDGNGLIDEGAGHGTHVAGIVHLVAPDARIMPVRVLDSDGLATDWTVVKAMFAATEMGADIVNLSFGRPGSADLLRSATQQILDRGVVVVAAAGNEGRDRAQYPAASRCAIAVAASDSTDSLAPYTTIGSWVDTVAPGTDIVSIHPFVGNGYASSSGTSMAAPFVAGQAALLLQIAPRLSPAEIHAHIRASTSPLTSVPDQMPSVGRIDLLHSLESAVARPWLDPETVGVDDHCD